jgi:hypothetical protein
MFYSDDTTTPVANSATALRYQSYLRQFITGNRNTAGYQASDGATSFARDWQIYGPDSQFFNITLNGFQVQSMPESRITNCRFLNQLVANPANGA